MGGIKVFIVLAVRSFDFPIMSGGIGLDQFVLDEDFCGAYR